MKQTNVKKLAVAGVFCAVAVVGSLMAFPGSMLGALLSGALIFSFKKTGVLQNMMSSFER